MMTVVMVEHQHQQRPPARNITPSSSLAIHSVFTKGGPQVHRGGTCLSLVGPNARGPRCLLLTILLLWGFNLPPPEPGMYIP